MYQNQQCCGIDEDLNEIIPITATMA